MKYGFIGCGNMGGAIATALSQSTKDILLADHDTAKARTLADTLGCTVGTNEQAAGCERLYLAVKPQMMREMLQNIAPTLQNTKPLLITMAAGLTMAQIEEMAGGNLPVIRIMPNTPVSVGKGMILYCCNHKVTAEQEQSFVNDLAYAGLLDKLEEKLIDAGCALSGCGPAYMYLFIESLADGAVACGLPRDKAMRYAAATMAGAAELVLQSGKHPGVLKDAVCSPGGSTIMGVKALEQGGLRAAAINAVQAAFDKNKELGK